VTVSVKTYIFCMLRKQLKLNGCIKLHMLFIIFLLRLLQHKGWRSVGHQVLQPTKDVKFRTVCLKSCRQEKKSSTASNLLGKYTSFNGPIIECLPVIAEGSFASINQNNKPSIIFAWPWRVCLFPLPKGYGCYVWYVTTVAAFWQNCFCCCLIDIHCIYFSH